MSYSDKLRHFPATDPPSVSCNEALREKIQAQVQDYLANGGTITPLTSQDYIHHNNNMKRSELIEYLKKTGYSRRWNNGRSEW
jgi:hypothetical protein